MPGVLAVPRGPSKISAENYGSPGFRSDRLSLFVLRRNLRAGSNSLRLDWTTR